MILRTNNLISKKIIVFLSCQIFMRFNFANKLLILPSNSWDYSTKFQHKIHRNWSYKMDKLFLAFFLWNGVQKVKWSPRARLTPSQIFFKFKGLPFFACQAPALYYPLLPSLDTLPFEIWPKIISHHSWNGYKKAEDFLKNETVLFQTSFEVVCIWSTLMYSVHIRT